MHVGRFTGLLVVFAAWSTQAQTPVPANEELEALEARMVELVNVEREARGIPALTMSTRLSDIARVYSALMAETGDVRHDLSTPVEERVLAVAPDTCRFGENIAKNTNLEYALGDLLASEGHRANLLDRRFTLLGVGIVRGENGSLYITQNFTRLCDARPGRMGPAEK